LATVECERCIVDNETDDNEAYHENPSNQER